MAAVCQTDGHSSHVHAGDAGALHGNAHSHSADLAIAHVAPGELFFPVHHPGGPIHALLHVTAFQKFMVIGRHNLALLQEIHPADSEGIDSQQIGRLV